MEPWDSELVERLRKALGGQQFVKSQVVDRFCNAWTHIVNQTLVIQNLREENEILTKKLIADHEEVISLQKELKEIREEEIEGLKTTIEGVVERSVDKSVAKSWSTVAAVGSPVSAPVPVVDTRAIRQAVQDASEADSRAANVVVFGLTESAGESVTERLDEILDCVGEKPPFEADRIGTKKEGAVRPVLVKFRSGAVASWIRRKAGALKSSEKFKSVYICPDRTILQRKEHRDCVQDLRKRCQEQPDKDHVIRDGMVISRDRVEKDKG